MPLNMANLERRGSKLYVVKTIPPSLWAIAGKKRLRKATGTGDLQQACRRRPAILAEFEKQLSAWRRTATSVSADPLLEEAQRLGDWAREQSSDDEGVLLDLAEGVALQAAPKWVTSLEQVEQLPSATQRRIERLYNTGLGTRTLVDLLDKFLDQKALAASTKLEYRRDIEKFLAWSNVVRPEQVRPDRAASSCCVHRCLSQRAACANARTQHP